MACSGLLNRRIGNYILTEALGQGFYAEVYVARHYLSGERLAVKVFPKSHLTSPGAVDRFQREIDAMHQLTFPGIVRLWDLRWDDDHFYLFMDYCQGGDLFGYLQGHRARMEEPLAAFIFKQLAGAIAYCHRHGVAHRDIKPENVLITEFPLVKLGDFGLCGFVNPDRLLATFCGSPCYCAPECLQEAEYDGMLCDIWSLGVLLYVMVTADMPWDVENSGQMHQQIVGAHYRRIPPCVSRDCQDLIRRMLQPRPEDRIGIELVLAHPWMAMSEFALALFPEDLEEKWKALKTISQTYLGQELGRGRAGRTADFGIVSPFRDEEAPAEAPPPPPPPPPRVRASPSLAAVRSVQLTAVQIVTSGNNVRVRKNVVKKVTTTPTFT
jgi:serine/threonine protein kinase